MKLTGFPDLIQEEMVILVLANEAGVGNEVNECLISVLKYR